MGLFGTLFKVAKGVVGGAAKLAASHLSAGLSDKALKLLKGRGQVPKMSATEQVTEQSRALANKLSGSIRGEARPSHLAQVVKAYREGTDAPAKAPRPCAYGPRDADGYCPPKPAGGGRAGRGRAGGRGPRPCKYGERVDGYCPPRPSGGNGYGGGYERGGSYAGGRRRRSGLSSIEKYTGQAVLAGVGKAVEVGGRSVGSVLKTGRGAAGLLGVVALAGIASYWVTTKIIQAQAKKRFDRNQLKHAAADAYRRARVQAEAEQGQPLTAEQLRVMSDTFHAELEKQGVSTSDLRF